MNALTLPPQINDLWAATYFQVLALMMVFALGVPPIVFQMAVPEEVRNVIYRRMKRWRWYALGIIAPLPALGFIWWLHPCPPNLLSTIPSWVSAAVVTFALVLAVAVWMWHIRASNRQWLIKTIKKSLVARFRLTRSLEESSIDDLTLIGELSKPGLDKDRVISAFGWIAESIQEDQSYDGNSLDLLAKAVSASVVADHGSVAESNLRDSVALLNSIRAGGLRQAGDGDTIHATTELLKVGKFSARSGFDKVTLSCINAVSDDSDALFELGHASVRADHWAVAQAAFSKLDVLADSALFAPRSISTINYFGLFADFYSAGGTARERAISFLHRAHADIGELLDFPTCVGEAIAYHSADCRFDTADALRALPNPIA